jgi:hypothetical protein
MAILAGFSYLTAQEAQTNLERAHLSGTAEAIALVEAQENLTLAQTKEEEAVEAAAIAEERRLEAERQQQLSLAQSLASLMPRIPQNFSSNDTELATLLGVQAGRINEQKGGDVTWLIDNSLRAFLTDRAVQHNHVLAGHTAWGQFGGLRPRRPNPRLC